MWNSKELKRRSVLSLGVAAISALALTACGGGSGTTSGPAADGSSSIVFSTWGTPEELTRFTEFNTEFMKRHPDIKVKLQPVASYGEYHSKLLAQLTSKTAPDVFYVGDDKLGQFVGSKRLLPLDDLMASDASKTKKDEFFPGTFGAAQQDGITYAAPNDVNNDPFWYDKKVLAEAGITEDPATLAAEGKWTTAKFLEMNDKIAAKGLIGSMFWNYWATHYGWISTQGGTAYDASGAFVGNKDPKTLAAVETLGKYFQDKKFIDADSLPSGAGADSKFVTHKAGFFAQGRYTIGTLKGAKVEEGYDIVDWPTPDGKAAPTGIAASYLAINGDTKNKDAAFTYWTEFLSAEGQTFRLTGGGNAVPSIKGADGVVLEDGYPKHAQTFLDMRNIGFANYATEGSVPALSTDISDLFLELYQGKNNAQGTLDKVASLIESKTGK